MALMAQQWQQLETIGNYIYMHRLGMKEEFIIHYNGECHAVIVK